MVRNNSKGRATLFLDYECYEEMAIRKIAEIGREIAIGLAAAGARVALVARTQTQLDEVAETIQKAAGTSIKIPADLSDQQSWRPAVDETVRLLGRVDILINNAAVVAPLGPTQTLEPDDVQAALTINVGAAVVLTGLVLPGMLTHGWGRIVNISSGIAEHPAAMIGGNPLKCPASCARAIVGQSFATPLPPAAAVSVSKINPRKFESEYVAIDRFQVESRSANCSRWTRIAFRTIKSVSWAIVSGCSCPCS